MFFPEHCPLYKNNWSQKGDFYMVAHWIRTKQTLLCILDPPPALGNTWDIWHQHEWQSTWLSPVNCLPRQTRVFSFSLCIRSYSQVAGRHTVQFIWQQEPCWASSQAPQISFKGGVHQCNETGWKACVRERWGGQEEKRRRQPWPLLLSLLS